MGVSLNQLSVFEPGFAESVTYVSSFVAQPGCEVGPEAVCLDAHTMGDDAEGAVKRIDEHIADRVGTLDHVDGMALKRAVLFEV